MAIVVPPQPRVPETRLAALMLALLVALAFIAAAELDPEGPRQGVGVYGYFLLQAGGWFGLRGHRKRFSRILGALFVLNLVFFVLLDLGLLGPQMDLIALNLVSIFFTAIAGAIALVLAIAIETSGRPGGLDNVVRVLIVVLVAVAVGAIAFAAVNRPPPSILR